MKRLFDITLSVTLCILFICPCFFIAIAIKLTSKGGVLYWSDRVGKNNNIFKFLEDYHDKFENNQQEFLTLSKKIIKLKEISNKLKNVYQEDVKLTSIINNKIRVSCKPTIQFLT